jgi:hypothetical protein
MNVFYLLEQDFQKLIDLRITDAKGIELLKRYIEQIGQTSVLESGTIENSYEYDLKKYEYKKSLEKKFKSASLREAAEKVKFKQSVSALLED